jgi:hypothetical protein
VLAVSPENIRGESPPPRCRCLSPAWVE